MKRGIAGVLLFLFSFLLMANYNHSIANSPPPTAKAQPPPSTSETKLTTYPPFEHPKVRSLADCILLLQPKQTPFIASFIAYHVHQEGQAKGLDPDLILAQMWVESGFMVHASSNKDAIGLLQVRYPVWKLEPELTDNGVDRKSKLFWADLNIKSGTDILARYLKEANGDIAKALYRYYCGDTKLPKKPWEIEYISKIMYYYYKIREHQLNGAPLEKEEDYTSVSPPPTQTTPNGKK